MISEHQATSVRVAFFGDSITFGLGDSESLGWTTRLVRRHAREGRPICGYNLGVRGDTSELILGRWEMEAAVRLPKPGRSVLAFSFGLNDATRREGALRVPLARSVAIAEAMIGRAMKTYRVVWIGPTPINEAAQPEANALGVAQRKSNRETMAYNAAYARLAHRLGVGYIDLFTLLSSDGLWQTRLDDGVHPNAEGYEAIAGHIHTSADWVAVVT